MKIMFNPQIFEDLGYYVYGLKDPRDTTIFYIGKGVGNRIFQHVEDSHESDLETKKLDRIREIKREGYNVQHLVLRHGMTEDEAFTVESTLIDLFLFQGQQMTNLVQGHNVQAQGIRTVDEICRLYEPENLEELCHPVAIININKRYKRGCSNEDIYQAVREA